MAVVLCAVFCSTAVHADPLTLKASDFANVADIVPGNTKNTKSKAV
jgi:hypothetical protein